MYIYAMHLRGLRACIFFFSFMGEWMRGAEACTRTRAHLLQARGVAEGL